IWPGNYAIVVPRQLREHLEAAGWSKTDVAEFIHRRARVFRREWAEGGKGAGGRDRGDRGYHPPNSPQDLLGVVGGGPPGPRGALGRRHPALAWPQGPRGHRADRRLHRLRTAAASGFLEQMNDGIGPLAAFSDHPGEGRVQARPRWVGTKTPAVGVRVIWTTN